MWQKCWNQNANLAAASAAGGGNGTGGAGGGNSFATGMRYRERGPMKSWRPETMAEVKRVLSYKSLQYPSIQGDSGGLGSFVELT